MAAECLHDVTMTTAKADFRELVQRLRERTGLTQEKFAARLGVTFPTINRWENGHARPSPLALKQIEALVVELGEQSRDLHQKFFAATPLTTSAQSPPVADRSLPLLANSAV